MRGAEIPPWYSLLRAARYMGVAPWELAERSSWWMNVALEAERAEKEAEAAHAEMSAHRT